MHVGNQMVSGTTLQTNMAATRTVNERLNTGMAPTCNWRIKIVSN